MNCPKCGYNHASPPKCRACGAEITEEVVEVTPTPIEEAPEEPVEEEAPSRRKRK